MTQRPYTIILNSISADGRLDWFQGDVAQYYQIAAEIGADATLTGADTMLLGGEPDAGLESEEKIEGAGWLIVTDSKGRIANWTSLKKMPYWKDIIVLCSDSTPKRYLKALKEQQVKHIVCGGDHVDLAKVLNKLFEEHGIRKIRVDSGGSLNAALLRQGLVDEVVLLINPYLVGGRTPRSFYPAPDLEEGSGIIQMKLVRSKRLKGGVELLRYKISAEGNTYHP